MKKTRKILSIIICLSMFFMYLPAGLVEAIEPMPLPQTSVEYAVSDYALYASRIATGEYDDEIAIRNFTVVVKPDQTLALWGDNTYGQLNVPDGLTEVKAIAAGSGHVLALKEDGTLVCWGSVFDSVGAASAYTIPAELEGATVKSIAAGGNMSAVIKEDGGIVIWGRNTKTLETVPAGVGTVVAIAISNNYAITLNDAGNVTVWGKDANVPEGLTGNVVAITAGAMHWLALKQDGTVAVSGASTHATATLKTFISGLSNVRAIGGGLSLSTALMADGTISGMSKDMEITTIDGVSGLKTIVGSPLGELIYGMQTDGTLFGWSKNDLDFNSKIPVGLNLMTMPSSSTLPQTATEYAINDYALYASKIAVGEYKDTEYKRFTVAIKPDNTLAVWGDNTYGQLNFPAGLIGVKAVSAGSGHVLALKEDGKLACWGSVFDSVGVASAYTIPAELEGVTVKSIAAGGNMSAVIKEDGGIVIWGRNTKTLETVPEEVGNVVAIAISNNYAITLNDAGNVTVWGRDTIVPEGLTGNVVAISSGSMHWLALKQDGTVAVSGASTHATAILKTFISGLSNVRAIGGGLSLSTALMADGTIRGMSKDSEITAFNGVGGLKSITGSSVGELIYGMQTDGTLFGWSKYDTEFNSKIPAGLNLLTMPSSNANLSSLVVTGYELAPAFNGATTAYSISVPNDVTSVEVTATIADANATLKIKDIGATSGVGVTMDSLIVGDNPVSIEVKAVDTTVKTYTLTIKRAYEFSISQVRLLNPFNQEITSVTGQSGYRVEAQIANMLENTTNGLVIVQIRNGEGATAENGGKILNCIGVGSGIPITGSAVTSDYVLPLGLTGTAYIDVFVWDGWEMQAPLSNPDHSISFTVN